MTVPPARIPMVIAFAVAGIFGGRLLHPLSSTPGQAAGSERSAVSSDRGGRKQPATKDIRAHDYAALKKLWWRPGIAKDPLASSRLAAMSVEEIRDLCLTLNIPGEFPGDSSSHDFEIKALITELHCRFGTGLMDWVDSLEDDIRKRDLFETALEVIVAADPSSADRWLERYGDQAELVGTIVERTVLKDAVIYPAGSLLEVMGENPKAELVGPFPEDFDFAAVHAALKANGREADLLRNRDFLRHWAARDKEAVWKATKEEAISGEETDPIFQRMIQGVVASDGEAAGMSWIMDRWEELPAAVRAEGMRTLIGDGELSIEGYTSVLSLFSEEERGEFAGIIANSAGYNVESICDVLAAVPRPARLKAIGKSNFFGRRYIERLHRGEPVTRGDRRLMVPDEGK